MSCLNVEVSLYENCFDVNGCDKISLQGFLEADCYKEDILKLRGLKNPDEVKSLKKYLPCVTPSGIFKPRSSNGLQVHSKLLGIDIDAKDNLHDPNFNQMNDRLSGIENIAYCGRSAYSGYFVIIPIEEPKYHEQYFNQLESWFKKQMNIVIDSHCKNVDRLRSISYDDAPYFNHNAIPLSKVEEQRSDIIKSKRIYPEKMDAQTKQKLETCLDKIGELKLDITGNDYTWFQIGCVFANLFGEKGRDTFHFISQYYKNGKYQYSITETNKKYDGCLKSGKQYTIGTFFYFLKQAKNDVLD